MIMIMTLSCDLNCAWLDTGFFSRVKSGNIYKREWVLSDIWIDYKISYFTIYLWWKILFLNETKRYEIQHKVEFKKSLKLLLDESKWQWRSIICKHNVRWHHVSQLKASVYCSLQKNNECKQNTSAYTDGTDGDSFHQILLKFEISRFRFYSFWKFSATFQTLLNLGNFRLEVWKGWQKI
jgi:hypothetical protein